MSEINMPLEDMTLRQLRRIASDLDVSRYSRMRKDELIEAIQAAQARRTTSAPAPTSAVEGQTEVEAAK
ncbi:MAG: Rho termination factor N-terminal domain-containing protein, partial [Cyanobacteria bacterium]|nr:Rho termination factor N-terminal domain-containing protein [Cyanobacteriota bacterium]